MRFFIFRYKAGELLEVGWGWVIVVALVIAAGLSPMTDPQVVYIRDISSGRIHKRFRIEGQAALAGFEADNADQAGAYELIDPEGFADAPAEALCRRCFQVETE